MATEVLECRGLRCPQPVLKLAIKANSIAPGTTLEINADCNTFSKDVEKWCADTGKVLISCVDKGGFFTATIQF